MSDVVKLIVLLSVLAVSVGINAKYNDWYYKNKLLPVIKQQSIINQDLNDKLETVLQDVDLLEFEIEVNNRLMEEVLMEQIKQKGD